MSTDTDRETLIAECEATQTEEAKRNVVTITARRGGKTSQMVEMMLAIASERGLDVRVVEPEAGETEWTTEPDATHLRDLRADSRLRSSLDLIREANSVRDLDGTGIVGRLADMLAGWLPIPESEEQR